MVPVPAAFTRTAGRAPLRGQAASLPTGLQEGCGRCPPLPTPPKALGSFLRHVSWVTGTPARSPPTCPSGTFSTLAHFPGLEQPLWAAASQTTVSGRPLPWFPGLSASSRPSPAGPPVPGDLSFCPAAETCFSSSSYLWAWWSPPRSHPHPSIAGEQHPSPSSRFSRTMESNLVRKQVFYRRGELRLRR